MPLSIGAGTAIAGAISGIGSLFNGGMSVRAVKRYNKGQMQIAQLNNEWNANQAALNRQWEESQVAKQNQWNLDQWNRENEYNSPVAQAERLKAAGINPAFMSADGNTAGSVTSASPGSVASPTASTPNMMPATFGVDLNGVANAVNGYYANKEAASRTVGNNINNGLLSAFGKDKMLADIASSVDGKFEWLSPVYRKSRMDYASNLASMSIDKDIVELQSMKDANQLQKVQTSIAILNADAQKVLNKYLNAQQQAELFIKAATLVDIQHTTKERQSNIKKTLADTIKTEAETKGVRISNHIAEQTAASVIAVTNASNDYQVETFQENMRNFIPRFEAENKRLKHVFENMDLDTRLGLYGLDEFGNKGNGYSGYKGTVARIVKSILGEASSTLLGGLLRR